MSMIFSFTKLGKSLLNTNIQTVQLLISKFKVEICLKIFENYLFIYLFMCVELYDWSLRMIYKAVLRMCGRYRNLSVDEPSPSSLSCHNCLYTMLKESKF